MKSKGLYTLGLRMDHLVTFAQPNTGRKWCHLYAWQQQHIDMTMSITVPPSSSASSTTCQDSMSPTTHLRAQMTTDDGGRLGPGSVFLNIV